MGEMQNLVIDYGYPSLMRGLSDEEVSLDLAVERFGRFDKIIWGEGLEDPLHDDHFNAATIIAAHPSKDFSGYIQLSNSAKFPFFTQEELITNLIRMKIMGMKGVLFDLFEEEYGSSDDRADILSQFAHRTGLNIIYNVGFAGIKECWYNKRIFQNAQEGDFLLLEGFGIAWDRNSMLLMKKLPDSIVELQNMGIGILGVSTYNPELVGAKTDLGYLLTKYVFLREEAERLGLLGYQLTNGLYSATGPEQDLVVDYNSLLALALKPGAINRVIKPNFIGAKGNLFYKS
jgi:hypothetical protein